MKNKILSFNDGLYQACIWISGASVFVMSLIIPWGIFARYVLGTGSRWPEPISILLMVVFTFFGAAAAYRAGSHIAVAMMTDRLPANVRRIAGNLVQLLLLAVSGFMVFYGAKLCNETWLQSVGEIPWMPVGATYMPVPVGGFITLLFVLEYMIFGSQADRRIVTYDHASPEAEAV